MDVSYTLPLHRVVPKEHMTLLGALLPARYAPLQSSGDGIQGVYLAEISRAFAEVLAGLIGPEVQQLFSTTGELRVPVAPALAARGIDEWEEQIQRIVLNHGGLSETERTALIRARRGQGLFKQNVMRVEAACRITRVENPAHLVGSHIKPWRDSSNDERLDGANGLLLTPSIDHLFDRGFISFRNNGDLLVSPVADRTALHRMGVRTDAVLNVGGFSREQARYPDFHRHSVFLQVAGT